MIGPLDTLFTDLDPLGTGKSKPYTDKKNFFPTVKSSPMQASTALSRDSLTHVGFEDSLWDGCTNNLSELNYTNPVQSSYIPCQVSKRRISENSLRVALPPEDGRRSVSPGDQGLNPHSSYGSILELEASPRRYRTNDLHELYSTSQDSPSCSSKYGDCRDSSVDSSLNLPMPAEPPPALPERPSKSISLSPPPLPPKKQIYSMSMSTFSTPPSRHDPSGVSGDVYEYIPGFSSDFGHNHEPEVSQIYESVDPNASLGSLGQEISVSELVKMNVLELSQKLNEGRLPHHLSGMSLFELVEFIGKHTRHDNAGARQGSENTNLDTKPKFSDSFVSGHKPDISSGCSSQLLEDKQCTKTNLVDTTAGTAGENQEMYKSNKFSLISVTSLSHTASPSVTSNCQPVLERKDIGFEDDFSHFQPTSKHDDPSQVAVESTDKTEHLSNSNSGSYDKYAVFRELQLEEELVNAWKSPTEETKDALGLQEETLAEDILDPSVEPDQEENIEEEAYFDTTDINPDVGLEHSFQVVSGNASPVQRSDINQTPADEYLGGEHIELNNVQPISEAEHEADPGDGLEIYESQLDDPPGDSQADQDNTEKNEWATFDDNAQNNSTNFEFSSFLSKDEQDKILGKKSIFKPEFMRKESYTKLPDFQIENNTQNEQETRNKFSIQSPKSLRDLPTTASFQARYQNFKRFDQPPSPPKSPKHSFKNQRLNQDEDPFESEWEPAFYTRNMAEADSWDLSFQTEGGRQRRPTGKQGNLEEAFPLHKIKSGRSSQASSENMFNNPFNDNFVSNNGGAMSATPPVFEGDRISNNSDMSFQSGEILSSNDIFDGVVGFEDHATFKVEAKTKVSKSESVNIFSAADDPFDDDFFK